MSPVRTSVSRIPNLRSGSSGAPIGPCRPHSPDTDTDATLDPLRGLLPLTETLPPELKPDVAEPEAEIVLDATTVGRQRGR